MRQVTCPRNNCGHIGFIDDNGRRLPVECLGCREIFCSKCNEVPYHYYGECEDMDLRRREWASFLEENLASMETQDQGSSLQEKLSAVQGKIKGYQNEAVDQSFLEANCRQCPHCGVTVQKVSGCNDMRCGTDGHGGNEQRGCGRKFKWDDAPRYVADAPKHMKPAISINEWRSKEIHGIITCHSCVDKGLNVRDALI